MTACCLNVLDITSVFACIICVLVKIIDKFLISFCIVHASWLEVEHDPNVLAMKRWPNSLHEFMYLSYQRCSKLDTTERHNYTIYNVDLCELKYIYIYISFMTLR